MRLEHDLIPFVSSSLPPGPWLVFAPHPDDETFGMGGSIALAARQGIQTSVIVLTNGALGGDSALRREEMHQAAEHLSISEVIFWDFPDRGLWQAEISQKRLQEAIITQGPQTVFLPSFLEFHPDHRATTARILPLLAAFGYQGRIWLYEITRQSETNALVDISQTVQNKVAAISCYTSQLNQYAYQNVVLGINQARSLTLGLGTTHAEAFWVCGQRTGPDIAREMEEAFLAYTQGVFSEAGKT